MADDLRTPPQISSEEAAERVIEALDADRRALWTRALRASLVWALERTPRTDAWLVSSGSRRLTTMGVRATSWSAVLEDIGRGDAVQRAAALVATAAEFAVELERDDCPARLREQCHTVFGATLIPGEHAYEQRHTPGARHVLVGVSGALYTVRVRDDDGKARASSDIATDLRTCVAAERTSDTVLRVTSLPRTLSADVWKKIVAANEASARAVETALFSVFFDPNAPTSIDACGALAQAGGADNRCHWHALQLVVFRNARLVLVGNYTAGVEGEAAFEICRRLTVASFPAAKTSERAEPSHLEWRLDADARAAIESSTQTIVEAGGFARVAGFGRERFASLGLRPEDATVLALRLAMSFANARLDAFDCMINTAHFREGIATRTNTATPEASAFVALAKADPSSPALGHALRSALDAHRALVRGAKQMKSAEQMLHFTFEQLRRASFFARLVVRLVTIWAMSRVVRIDRELASRRPAVALDSSVVPVRGVAAVGRFGVFAPRGMLWVHHTIEEGATRFVIQASREQLAAAKELKRQLPRAFDIIGRAANADPKAATDSPPREPASPIVVMARLRGLLNAVAAESERAR